MGDTPASIEGLSVFTPRLIQDPYPIYRRLRDEAPAYLDPGSGELLLTRYDDVLAALRHPRLSSRRCAGGGFGIPDFMDGLLQPVIRMLSQMMLFSDPPDHTRLRGLANRAFTPRVVQALRPRVQQLTDELLDGLETSGPVDLLGTLAAWLPVMVIAELLGTEIRDMKRFKLWSDDLTLLVGGSTKPAAVVVARAGRGFIQLRRALRDAVRRKREQPGEDLLSALIAAEEQGDTLTPEELVANALLILAAGHETTTNLIGNGVLALLQNPGEAERLKRNPELIETAVEEVLRFDSPVQWLGRRSVEDLEINGHSVRAGQSIGIGIGAANRDPAQFPDPDRLDVGRADNRHLAFGQGIHFCLGAALARLEGQIAIGTLLERFPNTHLAVRPPVRRDNYSLRGLSALWVHLR